MVNMNIAEWAREKARKEFAKLFEDRCNVYEYVKEKQANGSTAHKEKLVQSDMPCRISFKSISQASENSQNAQQVQAIKLFIPPDIHIKAGSKLEISRNGVVTAYKNSGVPALYATHNEISLEIFKGWS